MYLIAIIIIIGLISGLIGINNYSKKQENPNLNKIKNEIEIETENLINYGTYERKNYTYMQNLMKEFLLEYSNYTDFNKLYFIFGNYTNFTFFAYHRNNNGNVKIKINNTQDTNFITAKHLFIKTYSGNKSDKVEIISDDTKGDFELNEGILFYFIVSQKINRENYVINGGSKDE